MMRWSLLLRGLGILILLIQFVRPDRTNPAVDPAAELHASVEVPTSVSELLRTSCYDCHSNETQWPWYAHVAPSSWFVARHVDEGRRHLNFSTWADYPASKADHKLEEIVEYVENGEMPLRSYVPLHPEANLSADERLAITDWAQWLRERMAVGEGAEDD
jgi:hypothetical protein